MGQSSSTQRDRRHTSPREFFTRFHAGHDRDDRNEDMSNGHNFAQNGGFRSSLGTGMNTDGSQLFSSGQRNSTLEPWEQLSPMAGEPAVPRQLRSIQVENGVQPDLQEYRSAAFARMAARRQSTMSRLGSRILPNSVIRGLLNSEEETPAEGHAHRYGIVSRPASRSEGAHSTSRFSPFSSLGSRGITRRRTAVRAPYFVPRGDSALNSDPPLNPTYFDSAAERSSDPSRSSWRRSARLHRVRNSLSSPISHMFGQSSNPDATNPPHIPPRPASSEDSDHLRSIPIVTDTRMDIEDFPHELDSVEPAIRDTRSMSPVPSPQQPGQGATGVRRLPSLLRARSTRVLRREEQTPLSRVLQLAAAAIAAQLSGTTGPVIPNIQALGNGGLDGSLENFIQTLQNATSAQANPTSADGSSAAANGPPPPVNFLRVFRFSNSEASRRPETSDRQNTNPDDMRGNGDGMDVDEPAEGNEGRTVTLVVVGVRSVPSGSGRGNDQHADAGPGLDALLGLPFLSPSNLPRNLETGGSLNQRAEGRPRVNPRPFTGGSSGLFANHDTLRQQGILNGSRRPSDAAAYSGFSSSPSVLSDSPPGPNPPPSTPAVPSGSSTPSRRLSTASVLPHLHERQSLQPTVEPSEESVPLLRTRHRRRSDSEYARHRDLGAGAVRRNGVVEPDNSSSTTGRSWLIYVVGTNLSENHPAFATPSLFTDVRILPTPSSAIDSAKELEIN